MDRHVGGKHVVTRPGTAYLCAIHEGETMQDALARHRRDTAWCERELGDVPHRSMTLTCNAAPVEWAEVADVMRLPSGEAAS